MVMTSQISPRISFRGLALVGAVGLAAYLASPIWACPPDDNKPDKTQRRAKAPQAKARHRLLVPPTPPAPPAAFAIPSTAPESGATTFEQFMHERDGSDRDDLSLEQRMKQLEREIERLYRQLQRLQGVPTPTGGVGMGYGVPGLNVVDLPPVAVLGGVLAASGTGGSVPQDGNCLGAAAVMDGQTVVRVYKLPGGKLDAIVELMVRDDVPIRVRPTEGGIEVHASLAQHCIFDLFCKLIDGEERVVGHALPSGKLKALTELMVRSDVPIFVERGEEAIKVRGTDVEQAVFDAFCALIHPGEQVSVGTGGGYAIAQRYADRAQQYEQAAVAQRTQLRSLRSSMRALQRQLRTMERQADRKADKADQYGDKGDECEDEAEELLERAREAQERGDAARSRSLMVKAEQALATAQEFAAHAEALAHEAEMLEDHAAQIEDHVDELEDQIEELEELVEDDDDDDD